MDCFSPTMQVTAVTVNRKTTLFAVGGSVRGVPSRPAATGT
jgi:hypothetical protein